MVSQYVAEVRADRLVSLRMPEDIEARFRANLDRVENLVSAYQPPAGGRSSVAALDVLRAAVVFLHATLEDVVRSVQAEQWPNAEEPAVFKDVPFVIGDKLPTKVTLEELATHYKGRTVSEIIGTSIAARLERSNFNKPGDLVVALRRAELNSKIVSDNWAELQAMMARRHWIVHRADRNDRRGSGQHSALSLDPGTVRRWKGTVETVCIAILAQLE